MMKARHRDRKKRYHGNTPIMRWLRCVERKNVTAAMDGKGVGGGEMQRDKRRRDEGRGGGKMKKTEALCRKRENSDPSVFSFLLKQCPL
jgi:hypothetical protein